MIIIFCNNFEQYKFFRRAVKPLNYIGKNVCFISNRLSIVMLAKKDGNKASYVCGIRKMRLVDMDYKKIDTFELKHGLLSSKKFYSIIERTTYFTYKLFKKTKPEQIWFWDGCNVMRQTIALIANRFAIKTLYFQLGNFPGKLFVDPKGVNVRSLFYKIYNAGGINYNCNNFINGWLTKYLENKRIKHVIPQKSALHKFNWYFFIDMLGFICFTGISHERNKPFKKLINFFKSRIIKINFDKIKEPFWLFPLQVNSGSQILWNTNISQLEAIKIYANQAQKNNCFLAVKYHPVENDITFIKEVIKLCHKNNILLVNGNLFELMEKSKKVITINSTAGMEAILINKPVEILGNAIYKNFNIHDLAFYINEYLIDIDPFENMHFTTSQLRNILNRAEESFLYQLINKK